MIDQPPERFDDGAEPPEYMGVTPGEKPRPKNDSTERHLKE